jgi:gliding motility-associated-like protein
MFKLPNLVKCTPRVAFSAVRSALFTFLLLCAYSQVNAQTVSAVINPSGGTSATDDIKIEVYDNGSIKVTRKGLLESYIRTDSSIGMQSFFDFKNSLQTLDPANLKSPSVCYISPVSGTGTYWDPYQVQIVGTILEKYKNYPTGQTGTVTCILSYVKNTRYFMMDWILHLPSTSSGTRALFYLSEQSVMGADNSVDPDVASTCGYGFANSDTTTIGIFRDTPCSGTAEAPRSHVYRTFAKFHSYEASIPGNRMLVDDNGYFPGNTIAGAVDGRGRSLAIMRELGSVYPDVYAIDPPNFKTFRILSGYGTTKNEFDTVAAVKDSIPEAGFVPATVQFSSASLSGNEGSAADGEHVASGITLKVSGGKLNAPAYVLMQVDPSVSYPHPAVAGTDYTLTQQAFLVPAGDYTTPKTVTIPNLHVFGNDALQYSRSLRLKLVATCTSLLSISGTSEADYTIVDDEARSMVLSIDSTTMYEGNQSKARIKVSSGSTSPEDIVITFSTLPTSTAGDSDYIVPASVTIPANQATSADFIIKAKSDKTLENTEKATIKFTGTMLGIPVTGQQDLIIQDSTYYNPAYAQIQMGFDNPVATSPVLEGYTGNVSFHLPAGVATEVPITMKSISIDAASVAIEDIDFTLNYYSGATFVINPGSTFTDVPFVAIADKLIEGPTPETITIDAIPMDNVGVGRTYPLAGPKLAIQDADYDPNMKVILTAVPTTIKEGDAGTAITVALPNGIKTNANIVVTIAQGLSSTASASDLVAALPASVTIAKSKNSITFPAKVQAKTDNLLENDESLWIVTKPAGYQIDSSMITIQDATGDVAANRQLNISFANSTLLEGTTSDVTVSFSNPAITAQNPIQINFALDPSSVASATDYTLPAPLTLPAGTNSVTIPGGFRAVTDGILETDEAYTLNPSSTSLNNPVTMNSISGIIQDATGSYPANKVITATPSVVQMDEGGVGYFYTYSLPTGITTEIPISITPVLVTTGSTASTDDYTLASSTLTLDKTNNHSITDGISIPQDGLIEGDETLILGGTASSGAMSGFTVTNAATVILKDKDKLGGVIISADKTSITEGGAGATITVKLPNGVVPSSAVSVTMSQGLSSQAINGYSGLPQTGSMTANSFTFPVTVAATTDNIVGDNQTLTIVVSAVGYPSDSIILQIVDATITDPSKTRITLSPQPTSEGSHVLEGNNYTVRASFPSGVALAQPVTMQISVSPESAVTASDYSGLPATVTIDPATGYGDFTFTALTDNNIEGSELVKLIGNVTSMTGIAADSLNVFIDDATILDPTKSNIQVTFDSTSIHKGSFTRVKIGFVDANVTSSAPITLNFTVDPSSTADVTNYAGIPSSVTLPAGTNYILLTLSVGDNHKLEGTTKLQFNLTATGYTVNAVPAVNILEYAGAAITLQKISDAGEPSTDGAFMVKLPYVFTTDVTVRLNSAYNSTNIQSIPVAAVVPAGADHLTLPVHVVDDKILQGDQVLTVTLQSASTVVGGVPSVLTVDVTPLSITVTDDEAAATGPKATGRQVLIEKKADAAQPSTPGSFRVRFNDSTLTVTKDVVVNYSVSGTAQYNIDYVALSGTATIPAGSNNVMIPVTPSGITSAGSDVSVVAQLQQATSTLTGITFAIDTHSLDSVIIVNKNVDTPQVNLSAITSSLVEGDTMHVTVRTTRAASTDLSITIAVTCDNFHTISYNGSKINGSTFQILMPAGSTQQAFTLKVDNNETSDDDGFVQVTTRPYNPLSFTAPYKVGIAGEIRNTLLDDDSMWISFAQNEYDIKVPFDTTNQLLPFTLRINRPASRIVTVKYEFYTPGAGELLEGVQAATPGKDYGDSVTPLIILPGQTDAEIPVLVNSVERNKMFGVRLLAADVTSHQHVPKIDSIPSAIGVIQICMDCDVDGDGVPDYIERYLTDGRWEDNNHGNLRVSPAVSPNHDGVGNDVMEIENIDHYPYNDVTIINRWGGIIFTTKSYNNQTNNFNGIGNAGSAKGQEVPDGSYFFIIHATDAAGKRVSLTGYIVIKR